jgi:hypothetical protein
LLRFAPSFVNLYLDRPGRYETEVQVLPDSDVVNCATLLRVPDIVALKFQDYFPIMALEEWHMFMQHPNAKRLTRVDLHHQRALCDATSVSLLSQLPLLRTLLLAIPAAPSASHFEPLADHLSLTYLALWGSPDAFDFPATVTLTPLACCTRLRILSLRELFLRLGALGDMLLRFAEAGGQLQELELADLHLIPMHGSVMTDELADDALNLELSFAAPYLQSVCRPCVC